MWTEVSIYSLTRRFQPSIKIRYRSSKYLEPDSRETNHRFTRVENKISKRSPHPLDSLVALPFIATFTRSLRKKKRLMCLLCTSTSVARAAVYFSTVLALFRSNSKTSSRRRWLWRPRTRSISKLVRQTSRSLKWTATSSWKTIGFRENCSIIWR
jgi:hypothetical protein